MIWLVLGGVLFAVMLTAGADKAFNWEPRLPRRPTFGQQMRALAVEFIGKLAILAVVMVALIGGAILLVR